MPNLRWGVETAWWALAIQGENFWCFPLMTWLIFFQRPFTFGCGEGCLPEPPHALTSTYGRCEAENWWRQKPKKSIGPVSQWGGERLLKTQSRHILAAWCGSTAHLRTHWISQGFFCFGCFVWFWLLVFFLTSVLTHRLSIYSLTFYAGRKRTSRLVRMESPWY